MLMQGLSLTKDSHGDHGIQRVEKVHSQRVGVSRFPQTIIHQGYIEQTILDFLERDGGPRVERCTVPIEVFIDDALVGQRDSYPITVWIERYGRKEIHDKLNGYMTSMRHTKEQMSNRDTDGSMNQYEAQGQSQLNHNGSETFKSSCKMNSTKAENGSSNGIFKQNCGQPVEIISNNTKGALDYAKDKPMKLGVDGTSGFERTIEVIKTKYLLGCDGAHSWIRRQLGIALEGNQTQNVWGVIDIIPLTDFRKYLLES